MDAEAGADKAARTAQAALDRQVLDRCAALTEAEIRTLAVADKWFAGIRSGIARKCSASRSRSRRAEGAGGALRPAAAGARARRDGVCREVEGAHAADGVAP